MNIILTLLICVAADNIYIDQLLLCNGTLFDFHLYNQNDSTITYIDPNGGEPTIIYFRLTSYISYPCNTNTYGCLMNSTTSVALTTNQLTNDSFSQYIESSQFDNHSLLISYPMNTPYSLLINITCNRLSTADISKVNIFTFEGITISLINISSASVCPIAVAVQSFWMYYFKYQYGIAILFWICGGLFIIPGVSYIKINIFLSGLMLTTFFFDVLICQLVMPIEAPLWALLIMVGISSIIGILVGIVSTRIQKVGMFAMGALCGSIVGVIIFSAILEIFVDLQWVLMVAVCVSAIICGAGSWAMRRVAIVVYPSWIGSYLIVRGCSWLIGGYSNEWIMYYARRESMRIYVYIGAMIFLTGVSVAIKLILRAKYKNAKDLEMSSQYSYFED